MRLKFLVCVFSYLIVFTVYFCIFKVEKIFTQTNDENFENPVFERINHSSKYYIVDNIDDISDYYPVNYKSMEPPVLTNFKGKKKKKKKRKKKKLPQTLINSSAIGEFSIPWLKTDQESIEKNKIQEQLVGPDLHTRTVSVHAGNISPEAANIDLSAPNCGVSSSKFIVNGTEAQKGAIPWIAALLMNGGFFCSANIISDRWLLTVAHAFEGDRNPDSFSISVGDTLVSKGTVYKIEKVFVHDRYNADGFKGSDITLLKTKEPIKMNQLVQPLCLPKPFQEVNSSTVLVAGWGLTSFDGSRANSLRQVTLNVMPIQTCSEKFTTINYKIFVSQLCTFNVGQDACQGDSGGPAIEFINGKGVLVGLVSYGYQCADAYPGVFTKVSYFISWINNIIKNN